MLNLLDFDFPLPEEQIAKHPVYPRDASRLLACDSRSGETRHLQFSDLRELLRPGDVLVLNRTRVLKARLFAENLQGRKFELLLLSRATPLNAWNALVRPGRYIEDVGSRLQFADGWTAEVSRSPEDSRQFIVQFPSVSSTEFFNWLERNGQMPLPPYMRRPAEPADDHTYQTVYAKDSGSVAAPTAGLHFTEELLRDLQSRGIGIETLLLQIGYGTFSPIEPEATQLHSEFYSIDPETALRLQAVRRGGGRVIAVGTTVLRALESAVEGRLEGETRLFIRPGYAFSQADGLITNFHLPQSSLFVLICAWMGTDRAQAAYRDAISRGYRFFSYGDAMAIL